MSKFYIIILCAALSGCGLFANIEPEQKLIVQREYIVRIPPVELMDIPPHVPNIDVDSAKQSDIARWIIDNENRMSVLENKIRGIAKFLRGEQDKLEEQAKKENAPK